MDFLCKREPTAGTDSLLSFKLFKRLFGVHFCLRRISMTSEDGQGTLTIRDVKEADQGAYTCEAINAKGLVFGIPDGVLTLTSNPNPGNDTSLLLTFYTSVTPQQIEVTVKVSFFSRCPQATVLMVTSVWRAAVCPASVQESPRTARPPVATATRWACGSPTRKTSKALKP